MRHWTNRQLSLFLAAGLTIGSGTALAQKGGAPSGSGNTPSTASPGVGSNSRSPTNPSPLSIPSTTSPNSTNNGEQLNRPIFLSGRVMFDDGSPANPEIRIERVCGGNPRLEARTDSKGRFSFQLGGNFVFDADASDSISSSGVNQQTGRFPSDMGGLNRGQLDNLWSCELRAAYPGYRSDTIPLGEHRALDDPNVGTIILHRLVNVKGSTISLTTAEAPKSAQKNYQKGLQLAQKGKFDEAEKHFVLATEAYPKFAEAWFALGQTQQRNDQASEASKSYQAAIDADNKYVSPYDQLALLAAQQGRWEDAAKYSKEAIDLNPVEFPTAFWYNAVSNYNLKKPAEAEKSAQALVKLDARHRFPEAENLLAQLALEKGNYPEAAAHLRSYLQLEPNAKNADALKAELLKIEEANAETKK
ncbi:MAG TPA: tetratricopeptide repeat protein [Bryobacteraceae bacterium]|jgi:tetratricopeptide (TPR) repeat protein